MFLPIGLRISGKLCLLVGGGTIAAHKCRTLLEHGAIVRAVAESFNDEPVWAQSGVQKLETTYEIHHLNDASLAIAATDDPRANWQIAEHCRAAGIFVLCADSPEQCDWIMPATLRRGAFTISFGTDGLFPSLAARVKRDSSTIYGDDLARLCEEARALRATALLMEGDDKRRKSPLRDLADSLNESWHLGGAGRERSAGGAGKVFLVGAGPGDVGLITVKGAECLRSATVVVHDALANNELLDMYCSGALRVDVSKRKGMCLHMQPEINQILIDWASKGHTVVRLKGGDPMIFGRGGEEARALAAAGIDFEIVPGVSSLSSVPAYAGIPVTDREYGAASMGVYSLHCRNGRGLDEEQWQRMANGPETLVLFMGVTLLTTAVQKLIQYGRKPETPIALITQGTTSQQREVVSTLGEIVALDREEKSDGPGLIIIGNVINAKKQMQWFHPSEPVSKPQFHSPVDHVERQIEVVLIRHAEIEESHQGRYIGSLDVPLGERGMRQARAIATVEDLHQAGKVFASPMLRVRQTLEAVSPEQGCEWLEDLREIDFGSWENRTFSDIAESDPVHVANWAKLDGSFAFPAGDSLESFQRRVSRAATTIVNAAHADESCQRVFVYTHGGVIRSLIGHWLGLPLRSHLLLEVSRASISTVRLYGDRGVLTKLNDTAHLTELKPVESIL